LTIDLSQLLKGRQFTVFYNLVFNKHGFKTFTLIDIKANNYIFINIKFVQRLFRFFFTFIHTLLILIIVYKFDKQSRQTVNRYIVLYLHVNNCKQYNVFIVLFNTSYQDLIFSHI